jgi:hypothetical protein
VAAIKIRDMFQQPIDRDIKGVIKVGQQEDENIKQELEEYVVTSELRKHISGFYKSFNKSLERPYDKMGVWISGFFGSGKSHLLKILSHLLENRHVDGSPSIDYIEPKLKDPLLTAEICRAAEVPKDVILFNIDSKSDSSSGPDRDTVMQVFAKVFFEMLGLCANPPWLGNMEWKLLQRGKYEEYCQAYRAITGCAWQERRRTALFEEENIAKAMVRIGLLDDSRQYGFLEHTKNFYEMSPEIFARMVSEYLDMRSPNHKIVFLVDEMGQYIAGDQRMILNLQTVAEDLGTFCKGRAWLAVTSQQAIDEIVAEVPGEDFSKILARFDTRLALSSANVDEVIKRRLLEKTPVARDTLHLLYEQKEAILRNLFTFSDNTPNQRVYESGNEFSETYPFVPYQFDVLQAVFEEVRRHGASGKHLAKGARSMLSAAQFGTLTVADHEVGALIPFSHFYDSMEEFLEPSITEVIEAAKRNNALDQPFDVEVLKTLFMLKWTHETIPSTAENVTILMSSTLDEDKLALRQQVMVSLDRLVRQSLVQKDADLFIFLTDDEQEIDREIKRINYEPSQIARLFHEATFGASGVFPPKKIRYQKVHDFDFFQYVDGMRFGSLRAEIGISVMTPFSHGNINLDKQSILSKSALNTNQVFMVFPNDPDLREQAETSLKLETYLKQKSRTNLPYSILRILESREKQFKRSKDEFARSVERGIAQATFYADGRKLDIRSSEPSVRLTEALRTVVPGVYTKINYIHTHYDTTNALLHLLDESILTLEKDDPNRLAIDEIRQYISDCSAGSLRITMKTLIDRYTTMPYGWLEYDIAACVITLHRLNGITLTYQGAKVASNDRSIIGRLTKYSEMDKVIISHRKPDDLELMRMIRDIALEVFSKPDLLGDTEDDLVEAFRGIVTEELGRVREIKAYYHGNRNYPGSRIIEEWEGMLKKVLGLKDHSELKQFLSSSKEQMSRIAHSEAAKVKSFFSGTQREFFDKGAEAFRVFDDNSMIFTGEEAREAGYELGDIIKSSEPYDHIPKIPGLVDVIEREYILSCDKARAETVKIIELCITEVIDTLKSVGESAGDSIDGIEDSVRRKFQTLLDTVNASKSYDRILALRINANSLKETMISGAKKALASKGKTLLSTASIKEVLGKLQVSNRELRTVDDVDRFVEELGTCLRDEISKGVVIKLR